MKSMNLTFDEKTYEAIKQIGEETTAESYGEVMQMALSYYNAILKAEKLGYNELVAMNTATGEGVTIKLVR